MLTKVIENVLDKWKSEGLELALPNSEKEITRIFAKIGKKISKDIIQLYSTIGGNSNGRMDNNLLSFWTLEDLIEENSKQKLILLYLQVIRYFVVFMLSIMKMRIFHLFTVILKLENS